MRRFLSLLLCVTATGALAQAPQDTFTTTPNPLGGFKLVTTSVLPAVYPRGPRVLISSFECKFPFTFLNAPNYGLPFGTPADEAAYQARVLSGTGLKVGGLRATCANGKITFSASSAAKLREVFAYRALDAETAQVLDALEQYPSLTFGSGVVRFMDVTFRFGGNTVTASAPSGLPISAGVSQGGPQQPVYLAGQTRTATITPGRTYRLHVTHDQGEHWFNASVAGASVTLWQSRGTPDGPVY